MPWLLTRVGDLGTMRLERIRVICAILVAYEGTSRRWKIFSRRKIKELIGLRLY